MIVKAGSILIWDKCILAGKKIIKYFAGVNILTVRQELGKHL